MCLPDFIEFKDIPESEALIGYRRWRNKVKDSIELISLNRSYIWPVELVSHEVIEEDSGIYAYNNYNNYSYNYNYNDYKNYYYNNNNCNNYNYNNYNYYSSYNYNDYNKYDYYNVGGIIKQFRRVAIHKTGYRSQYAIIDSLFTIRESDAKGPKEFLTWVKEVFNPRVEAIARRYNAKTIHWQDFADSNKANQ